MPILLIAGDILSSAYHEAKEIADDLVNVDLRLELETLGLVEAEWVDFLERIRLNGGQHLQHWAESSTNGTKAISHPRDSPLILHSTLGYIGDLDEFIRWADHSYGLKDPRQNEEYANVEAELRQLANQEFSQYVQDKINKYGWKYAVMEISNGDNAIYRLVIELYHDKCPKTVDHFLTLCTGEKGANEQGVKLHYQDSLIHRIVKDGWIQGGDLINGGKGNQNISANGDGSQLLADECFTVKHDRIGMLSSSNTGPHTNGSQFFFSLRSIPAFDGRFVAFGRVIVGINGLEALNKAPTRNQRPTNPVAIVSSGLFTPEDANANVEDQWLSIRKARKQAQQTLVGHQEKSRSQGTSKKATILVIGLESSGKSTVIQHLQLRANESTLPTKGLDLQDVQLDDYSLRFHSLGGSANIRNYWNNYYDDCHAVVLVLDASQRNAAHLATVSRSVRNMLDHPLVQGKPVLILGNKTDIPHHMNKSELMVSLDVDELTHGASSTQPLKLEMCSAIVGLSEHQTQVESGLQNGFRWLLARIDELSIELEERIRQDVAERKRKEKAEMQARKERMLKEKNDEHQ